MPTDSPSASSVFLPLGMRPQKTSISSPTPVYDQQDLRKALETIHSAASQSQDLTVFNEYTDLPPANPLPESKVLTTDIQGGLAGLYNKFRATVGGARESSNVSEVLSPDGSSGDRLLSQPTSGRTSRVQSPRISAFDQIPGGDALPHPSKMSSKTTSLSRSSVVTAPPLKSPTAVTKSSHLADPALSEVTIHATNNNKFHTKNANSTDVEDFARQDRNPAGSADEQSLRKALSKGVDTDARPVWQERHLLSPRMTPVIHLDNRNAVATSSHDRGLSEHSVGGRLGKKTSSVSSASNLATGDDASVRTTSNHQDSLPDSKLISNPLQLLGDYSHENKSPSNAAEPSKGPERTMSPPAQARERPSANLLSRVSQSRLPGFQSSRASSTDSGRTAGALALARQSTGQPAGTYDGSQDHRSYLKQPHRAKSRLLNKDFWMRDENARDCFRCGEPFTTFRRKHHCRTCGQIFDNKCTTLLSGTHFGDGGAIRVCKPCEAIVTTHEDDSSDYSIEDGNVPEMGERPRTPERLLPRFDDDNTSTISQAREQMAKTPVMSLPVRRAYDGDNRSSAILEFDASDRPLPRPSSSRSLRASHLIGHSHKRHPSKHQHIRSYKSYHEERAPFQRRTVEDLKDRKTSAFHRDSIIDPELAQYLSDDASSGEEESLPEQQPADKLARVGQDVDRMTLGGLLAGLRKGRSRIGDRSIAGFLNLGRELDDTASITSSRDGPRSSRKRNLSVASSVHHRITPRNVKERPHVVIPGKGDQDINPSPALPPGRASRMIRSASMRGIGAPSVELNRASLKHVQKLLKQLLKDGDVSNPSRWEDALLPILLRATDDVDPDVHAGDDMDIRNYVKLKKIPGGRPNDTSYISGLVFNKNVALKSMSRYITAPRILIITFPLEYARYEQHFMSLDPVIRQEREYLENIVGRIVALKPDLLLAQRNISGLALELLDKANVATVYNVKPSVLEAVSRCTQTRITHSLDKLSVLSDQRGTCETFEVRTFVAEGRKKSYVYISGCPPQLGCTIVLRGASRNDLSKIKRVTDFMIYVVYSLKLETCLMRDEWALIPTEIVYRDPRKDMEARAGLTHQASGSLLLASDLKDSDPLAKTAVGAEANQSNSATVEAKSADSGSRPSAGVRLDSTDVTEIPDDVPVPKFYEDLVDKHQTKLLSASPFVKLTQPYLLMRARELERRVAYLKQLRDQDLSDSVHMDEKSKAQRFTLIQPEMVHSSLQGASRKVREIVHAVHDAEYDKAVYNYETQKKQWEASLSGNRNFFDPYAHQNIVVLFSQVSTTTNVPCSGPDVLAFGFYNEHEHSEEFEADCTLGQYVEDLCYRANDVCPSEACERKLHEHHRQYVHGGAQITVFVQHHPPKLRGLQDVILMWSQCKICAVETTVTPMSSNTWKYSFGKYLELSFWSSDLHARAGLCPHDLHRDHLRFFGYKDFALRVHYDPIDLLEIVVPRMRITWKVDNDLKFRNDVFARLENRVVRFMGSVKLRLKSINVEALLPETASSCREEIEKLTRRANEDHTMLVKQLQELYTNSQHWEIIPLNRAVRALQEKVADWDVAFAGFEKNYFPSEKDIRRLATLQLKKIFLDRDVSVASFASGEEGTAGSAIEEAIDEKNGQTPEAPELRQPATLSPEKTQSVLQSVLEEHVSSEFREDQQTANAGSETATAIDLPEVPGGHRNTDDVQHLDLAVDHSTPKASVSLDARLQNSDSMPLAALEIGDLPTMLDEEPDKDARPEVPSTPARTDVGALDMDEADGEDLAAQWTNESDATQIADANPMNIRQDLSRRMTSPTLFRAHSQPTGSSVSRKEFPPGKQSTLSMVNAMNSFGLVNDKEGLGARREATAVVNEKGLSERLGISQLKNSKFAKTQSFIPRAIGTRKESRVSNLAKHFEQLSREFERERIRERKQRAARSRQSRVYPLAVSRPIVDVYRDVNEAVDESHYSDDIFNRSSDEAQEEVAPSTSEGMAQPDTLETPGDGFHAAETPVELTENDTEVQQSSHAPSETEEQSEAEDVFDDIQLPDSPEDLLRLTQDDMDLKELPKHERTSLMKMLTNFWAERSSSGWTTLEYPFSASDHIFADCDIIVREDEPSSIIAFALDSQDYGAMLHDIQDHHAAPHDGPGEASSEHPDMQADVMHSLLRKTGSHFRYQFQEGPAKMLCKIFFAEQFDAMRRKCGVADRFVESLSRCLKFDSRGGKSRSIFLKTLDDRFVLKSLSPVETQSFLKFAPNYFQIMSEAFFHELPSVIAKMLGFYQVIIKNPNTGVEYNWFLLVMENLFYDRVPTRIFDLKGSMRNRKIHATGERNEVLLDENMVEFIYESPLFAREHSKKLLRSSVHNDTLFLARQNVMDYSLMIAIDEVRKELVVGIIDCIRTYTWDKKLESWIKDRGFAGGGKNKPTVTSPKEYKRRFREAMSRYVLEAPSCWHQFRPPKEKRTLYIEGDGEKGEQELHLIT